jgi:uncharacterized protein (TIGR00106 family)
MGFSCSNFAIQTPVRQGGLGDAELVACILESRSAGGVTKRKAWLVRCAEKIDGILGTSKQKRKKSMVLLEFSMTPSTQEESKSPFVARILDVIDKSGLPYQLTPMGTIIEGDWAEVMAVVTDCFKALEVDCPRISSQIKIDYRAGQNSRMKSKIDAVESILGRKLST